MLRAGPHQLLGRSQRELPGSCQPHLLVGILKLVISGHGIVIGSNGEGGLARREGLGGGEWGLHRGDGLGSGRWLDGLEGEGHVRVSADL